MIATALVEAKIMVSRGKPKRRPSDTKQARLDRWHKYRDKNRDWLRTQGWTGDAETLVTAARKGKVKLTIEIAEKGNDDGKDNNTLRSMSR